MNVSGRRSTKLYYMDDGWSCEIVIGMFRAS